MERRLGTVSRGIRCPIIRENDDLCEIVCDSIIAAAQENNYDIYDKDIIGLTESIVARAQGNYASVDVVAKDIKDKLGDGPIGVVFPILSRNRFSTILKSIARAAKEVVLVLNYPSDEVGNALITREALDQSDINPYSDTLSLQEYRDTFGKTYHPFTGVDYVEYYKEIIEAENATASFVFSNNPSVVLDYTDRILTADVHENDRTVRTLQKMTDKKIYTLSDLLTKSIDGSGYNEEYGLLGANKASDSSLKLFPRASEALVYKIQKRMKSKTGKNVEVMVYGDGAFKDPVGKIWELADPTVAPGYTKGLKGTPDEVKLKYLADNDFSDLEGDALTKAINKEIKAKDGGVHDDNATQGTTPRRIIDLVGSLCDLTSGSGDKGTPIVHIQGYFDNYSSQ